MIELAEISPGELQQRLRSDTPPLVLDIREPWELALARLPMTIDIPMFQVPDRLDELDRAAEIVVMCHHGSRSRQVGAFLQQNGFRRVINLTGGIDAWSTDVDPGVIVY